MAIYPPIGLHFRVEFGLPGTRPGDIDSRFSEVSGLSVDIGVMPIKEGGENRFVHRLPERPEYGNLVLKRGMVQNSKLIKWFQDATQNFKFTPVDVTVVLLNENNQPLSSWVFVGAWPKKWSTSDFNAGDGTIVIDTIELVYKNFRQL